VIGNQQKVKRVARSSGTFLKGHTVSDEVRKKIGLSKLGNANFLGKKHTEETKSKMRSPKTDEHKKKLSIGKKGKTYKEIGRSPTSDSTRIKMSINNGQRGDKSIFWKGGTTKIADSIRNSFVYRQWRSDVYQRDNYICQVCGKRGGRLQADHVKQFAVILNENNIECVEEALDCEELWNINNGRTLCENCHKKTDTYLNKWHNPNFKPRKTKKK